MSAGRQTLMHRLGPAGAGLALALCAAVGGVGVVGGCEGSQVWGPAGRRARMVDEQLAPVLKQDFPAGTPRDQVRTKAQELGMTLVSHTDADDLSPEEDVYSFSFDPDSGWGVTRKVRVQYTKTGRVERTILVEQPGREAGTALDNGQPGGIGGWIHAEGAP